MLYLLLRLAHQVYALDAQRIVEVVPMVEFISLPHMPDYIAGLVDYRGRRVPVVDLCRLTGPQPCRARLTSRVVLVEYPGQAGDKHILGLLAEGVTETQKINPQAFQASGLYVRDAAYLGGFASIQQETVQLLDLAQLLPMALQEDLFREPVA